MPTAEATKPEEAKKPKYSSKEFAESLKAEMMLGEVIPEEAKDFDSSARSDLDETVADTGEEQIKQANEARKRIDAIHGGLETKLRSMLREKVHVDASIKAGRAEYGDKVDAHKAATVSARVKTELTDNGVDALINTATLDKVYAKLKELAGSELEREIKALAATMPEYQFGSGIDGGDVLIADLEHEFKQMSEKLGDAHERKKEAATGFVKKRIDATQAFIDARQKVNDMRLEGKAGAADITALAGNIEGTYEAANVLGKLVQKGDKAISRRTFKDPETGATIIELVYPVMEKKSLGKGSIMEKSKKEVVVEHWNGSKDGGEMIRSTLVRVDKKEVKRPQWKVWKGLKTVERPADATSAKWNLWSKYDHKLSKAARKELDPLSSGSIEASRRSESRYGGLKGRRATSALMAGRLGSNLGLGSTEASKLARSDKRRPVGFFRSLYDNFFNNASKISKKS